MCSTEALAVNLFPLSLKRFCRPIISVLVELYTRCNIYRYSEYNEAPINEKVRQMAVKMQQQNL